MLTIIDIIKKKGTENDVYYTDMITLDSQNAVSHIDIFIIIDMIKTRH